MSGETDKLTPKQEAFCCVYIESGNASEAYRKTHDVSPDTKPESVHRMAHELMQNPKITSRIGELRAALLKRHEVTVDRVIQELAKLGFANMLDYITTTEEGSAYVDLSKLTREQAAAIQEVTSETYAEGKGDDAKIVKRTKFKLIDKRAALVDLGRHLGIFGPKGTAEDPINVTTTVADEFTRRIAGLSERVRANGATGKPH